MPSRGFGFWMWRLTLARGGLFRRINDKPWFDDQCRHAYGLKQEARLRWTRDRSWVNWEEFVHFQLRAIETYSEGRCQFSVRNRDVLMNAQSPHKWWSTLKSAVLAWVHHCRRLLVEVVDWCASRLVRLICSHADHHDCKQSRKSVDLPPTCQPSPRLTTFASRSSEVLRLLLDLDP